MIPKRIEKGWGYELIFASNDLYCGKLLCFAKAGNKCSMHYHLNKHETWYVSKGSFIVYSVNTDTAEKISTMIITGDAWTNEIGIPHKLVALEDDSVIFEVSTKDDIVDNYRIIPGDSQQ